MYIISAFLSFKFVLGLTFESHCYAVHSSKAKKTWLIMVIICLAFEMTPSFKKQEQIVNIGVHFHWCSGLFEDSHREEIPTKKKSTNDVTYKGNIVRKANNFILTLLVLWYFTMFMHVFSSELAIMRWNRWGFQGLRKRQILKNGFFQRKWSSCPHGMTTCKIALGTNELFWHGGRAFIWVSIPNPAVNFLPEKDCVH